MTYEGLPSDWYLKLTGAAARMIRGEAPLSEKIPERMSFPRRTRFGNASLVSIFDSANGTRIRAHYDISRTFGELSSSHCGIGMDFAELAFLRCLAMLVELQSSGIAARQDQHPRAFTGEKTAWHGFDRYDWLMDQESSGPQAHQGRRGRKEWDQGSGEGPVAVYRGRSQGGGTRQPVVVARLLLGPRTADRGRVAQAGFSHRVCHVRPRQILGCLVYVPHRETWTVRKPAFIGMSRGGVNEYVWATVNPDKVSCIYADNPALRPESY